MSDGELYELAKRGQEHPESLTQTEIQELCLAMMEAFQPIPPYEN